VWPETAKTNRIQVLGARNAQAFAHFDKLHPHAVRSTQAQSVRPLWKHLARRLVKILMNSSARRRR
jgi:hypothetical protein